MFYSFWEKDSLKKGKKFLGKNRYILTAPKEKTCSITYSIGYALYLLYTDKEKNKETAINIIKEIIKFQNNDKNDINFGKISHTKVTVISSAFSTTGEICSGLLQCLKYYDDIFTPELKKTIQNVCINASFFLVSYYNAQGLTELSHMIYTTVTCGVRFNIPEYLKFGMQMLKTLHSSIIYHNSPFEYNDIEHCFKNIRIFQLLIDENENSECTKYVQEICDILWEIYAIHFHHGTMHPAGPFALSVEDYMSDNFRDFLYGSCAGKISFPKSGKNIDELAKCPIKYYPYFTEDMGNIFFQRNISKGMTHPFFRFSMVASTYKPKKFTFGSFNREVFWKSRKPFIGYFGTPENLYNFKISVLHDNHDFSSAALHSVQYKGYSLGHISIITDRGDKEITADGPANIIKASDFRIRFSVSGRIEDLKITHTRDFIEICYEDVYIYYKISYAEFEGYELKTKFFEDDNHIFYDLILHCGEKRIINFSDMTKAITEFIFMIDDKETAPPIPERKLSEENIFSQISAENMTLSLSTPIKPSNHATCFTYDKQYINGKILEDFVTQINKQTEEYIFTDKINQPSQPEVRIPIHSSEISEITDMISEIPKTNLNSIGKKITEIINVIEKNKYSLILQREFAFRISVSVLDCAKKADYKFEDLVLRKYSDIFYKISMATGYDEIKEIIYSLYNSVTSDFEVFSNNYKMQNVINNIIQIINKNITNPELSLKFIAYNLGYSTSHLSRLFYKEMQMNYVDYIQQQKIAYAITKLKSGDISVKEISEQLNYSTPSSFMRMFHKITGMTVIQYLKSNS